MRLTELQRTTIKQAAIICFSPTVIVRLFGSRLDDYKSGGDIDLLIQTDICEPEQIARAHTRFIAKLYGKMDEQKIDLLIDYPQRRKRLPIYDIAYKQGVIL